jgi:hypothetical protein
MMATETISALTPLAPVTVRSALEERTPVYPGLLAVIVAVPADTPVAIPEESTVATFGALEIQVDSSVTFCVLEG